MNIQAVTLQRTTREAKRSARFRPRRMRDHPKSVPADDHAGPPELRSTVSIALIDPKPLTRHSLSEMLKASLPTYVRLVAASGFDELIATDGAGLAGELNLVVLYIRSAGVADDWVQQQLQLIRGQAPDPTVIMISDREDTDDVMKALHEGIRGYIPTSIATEVAIAALTLIEAGGTYVPAHALRPEMAKPRAEEGGPAELPAGLDLTARELAVIDLLREGKANKVIALKLNMRESTVKVHVRNILKKLRVSNRTHAATVANRLLANARPAGRPNGHSEESN
jgi:DNA-binding NarL/FixJ family response regulator